MRFLGLSIVVAGALCAGAAVRAEPTDHPLAVLSGLERGEWELRSRDPQTPPRRICAADLRQLMQPRHAGLSCTRFVVEDRPGQAVVAYDCGGNGQGRTTLRRETARLVQIDSQGVAGGVPFAILAEARRIGPCAAQTASR